MRQSKFYIPTTKDVSKDAVVLSHQFMLKSGMIKQVAAGVYTYLPLMHRVIKNIEAIIKEELENIECYEMLMPALQPIELWKESNRYEDYNESSETMRLKDRHDRTFFLGPTHEEVVTDAIRGFIDSYKKLPLAMFQIQNKFRDEKRPRFGMMRAREFTMMDAYTFSENEECLSEWYNKMYKAYSNILTRCGLEYRAVQADSGSIGGDESHEFMVLSDIGEDTIKYCENCDFVANVEVCEEDICPKCGSKLKETKGIEVGHIFKLGSKYSEAMNAKFNDRNGKPKAMEMGCYGIGVSRLAMAIVEQKATLENGLIWPEDVKPFDVHLILASIKNAEQKEVAEKLYTDLKAKGLSVLFDDRDQGLGAKFKDSDLIGIPKRIVVGKLIKDGNVELTLRNTSEKQEIEISKIIDKI